MSIFIARTASVLCHALAIMMLVGPGAGHGALRAFVALLALSFAFSATRTGLNSTDRSTE